MSLMPYSRYEKGYKNLLKVYDSMTLDEKNYKQTFRIVYNRADDITSIEKICAFDVAPSYKFVFKATFKCTDCKDYAKHEIYFDQCKCGNDATISFSVLNSGRGVQAEFHLAVEKPDRSITTVSKETKKSLSNKKHRASFKLIWTSQTNAITGDFFSVDGKITFVLEIAINGIKPDSEIALPEQPKFPGALEKLAGLFSEKYIDVDSPPDGKVDFTLHVGKHKIYCHKLVLSLSSGYFDRMFESNMQEAVNNEVHLPDMDLITMKSLLRFMYDGAVEESKITVELLKASDRFEVMSLRQICLEKFKKSVSLENVVALWKAAYACNVEDLTHYTVAFMARHWYTLVEDENVLRLAEEHNGLMITISLLLSESSNGI